MACRGWPAGCMLGDGACDSASFDPQHAGASFCDVVCIRSIVRIMDDHYFNSPSYKIMVSKYDWYNTDINHPRIAQPVYKIMVNCIST